MVVKNCISCCNASSDHRQLSSPALHSAASGACQRRSRSARSCAPDPLTADLALQQQQGAHDTGAPSPLVAAHCEAPWRDSPLQTAACDPHKHPLLHTLHAVLFGTSVRWGVGLSPSHGHTEIATGARFRTRTPHPHSAPPRHMRIPDPQRETLIMTIFVTVTVMTLCRRVGAFDDVCTPMHRSRAGPCISFYPNTAALARAGGSQSERG